ncbi:MAG TPA: DUF2214 family protein [Candidatus Manganitrophaceae bacterium]|nr:DUF2214 family protein [Candidatus Manganitrophaceae bacterium]
MFWMIVVWIHIMAAMFWVGGMLFFVIVLVPVLRDLSVGQKMDLMSRVGKRFRKAGWVSLGVLLLTGLLNLYHRGIPLSEYGSAFWIKLSLFVVMVSLTLLHDFALGPRSIQSGRSGAGRNSLLSVTRWVARFNLVIGLFIILAAVYMARGY